jgi:hypothetical protein
MMNDNHKRYEEYSTPQKIISHLFPLLIVLILVWAIIYVVKNITMVLIGN